MNSAILDNKPLVKKEGNVIIDLTPPSIRYVDDRITIVDHFYVGEDMVMRPDLVALAAYGNVDNWDIILKYNGISNPFAVNYNDYILVPDIGEMKSNIASTSQSRKDLDIRKQYTDPSKKSSVDPKKLGYDTMVKRLKSSNTNIVTNTSGLPPNISEPGEGEAKYENGSFVLGAYIGK